jgi:hypothetical protein
MGEIMAELEFGRNLSRKGRVGGGNRELRERVVPA